MQSYLKPLCGLARLGAVILLCAAAADYAPAQGRMPLAPVTLRAVEERYPLRIPALVKPGQVGVRSTSFAINFSPAPRWGDVCGAWPADAMTAVQYAAQLWELELESAVSITVDACWASNLGPGVLGHAGAINYTYGFAGTSMPNAWHAVALANSLAGSDLDGGAADMYIGLSSVFTWYKGTDGNTPAGQYDLVSVVLHEIAHGLGFLGSMQNSSGQGQWGYSGMPFPYDVYVLDGAGRQLIDTGSYANPSVALLGALTGGNIFFHGPSAVSANSGQAVKLYAPASWSSGSSYSHVDNIYDGTINALMTYSISSGASQHLIGPIALGMLKAVGWRLADEQPTPTPTATPTPPGPTAEPTATPTKTPTATSTASPAPTPTASPSPGPSEAPSETPTAPPPDPDPGADLTVRLELPEDGAAAGESFIYSADVENLGPDRAVSVLLTSPLPLGLTILSAAPSQGSCAQTEDALNCSLGSLENGAVASVMITAKASAVGELQLSATAVGSVPDPDLSNNFDTGEIFLEEGDLPDLTGRLGALTVKRYRLKFSYHAENLGWADAPPSKVRFFVSRNAELDGRDRLIGQVDIPALEPDEGLLIKVKYRGRGRLNRKVLIAFVDPDSTTQESDEQNNALYRELIQGAANTLP